MKKKYLYIILLICIIVIIAIGYFFFKKSNKLQNTENTIFTNIVWVKEKILCKVFILNFDFK